jgi:hypothetical protein
MPGTVLKSVALVYQAMLTRHRIKIRLGHVLVLEACAMRIFVNLPPASASSRRRACAN